MSANFLFALVAFGSQLLVAKFLSDAELGYIKVFQSFIQIFGVIAGMGYSTSVLILCSDPKNSITKTSIFYVGFKSVIFFSIIVWLFFMSLNYLGVLTELIELKRIFFDYSFIIILTALTSLFTAYFQASRVFKKYALILLICKITSLVLIVVLTFIFGIQGFMNGLWIGLLLTLLINYYYSVNILNLSIPVKVKNFVQKSKDQLKIGLYGLGANIFGNLVLHIDVILLSYFVVSNPELIGQYSFATIIIIGLSMIQGTVVQIATPYFSKHLGSVISIRNLYKKYSLLLIISSIILFILLYFILPVVMDYVYADKFNLGMKYLKLLLLVWLFRCFNAINVAYLLSSGKTKIASYLNMIQVGLLSFTIVISLKIYDVTIMIFGMILVTLISYFISTTIVSVHIRSLYTNK